jgi:hypothetical protein
MSSVVATEASFLHLRFSAFLSCPLFMQEPTPSPIKQEIESAGKIARVSEMPNDFLLPRGKTVFIDFAKGTQATANELIQLIEKNENTVKTPDFDLKDIVKLFNNLEEKLRVCDTIILIYDKQVSIQWFIHRLLQYYHLSARHSTPLQVFIYTGDTEVGKLPTSISSAFNKEYGRIFSKHNLQLTDC